MEDFGYQKDEEQSQFSSAARRVFLVSATLFSIACFIYVTISAYYFVYQDGNSNIETIKSPQGPIKVSEDEQNVGNENSMQIDRSIYEDIFGNKKETLKQENTKIRHAPTPALPPKKEVSPPTIVENNSAPMANQEQKIVVYSDQNKKNQAKDFLTKTSGEERASVTPKEKMAKKRAVRVQVAAMTSRDAAEEQWNKLKRLYSNLFSGLKPFTEEVNLGKRGIFYRLQIGNFYNQIEAEEFCNHYVSQAKKSRADCIVVE